MTRAAFLEKAGPYIPAFFLALAAVLGGLRSDSALLVFAGVFLTWSAFAPGGLSSGGLKAPLLFFAWLGAAAVFSTEPALSLAAFSKYALPGLFFFLALDRGEGGRGWLAAVYALGAAAAAVFVLQSLSGAALTGFIGANPNYSAAFCAAAFGPALLALSGGQSWRERSGWALLVLLLAAGLFLSGSRGAALAAFVSAAAGLGLTRRWAWLAGLFISALAAAALLSPDALGGMLKLQDPRAFERPRIWGAALQAARSEPLLGRGPGLFGRAFEIFKFPYFDGLSYYGHSAPHAHSEVLNLAAEAGFPAAALFICAAAAALAAGWRERLPLKLCALAPLLQGSVDMIFYSGAVGLLFWGSLGFSVSGRSSGGGGRLKFWLAALCLAGLAAGPLSDLYCAGRLDSAYAEARAGRSPELALALARAAVLDNPRSAFAATDEGAAMAAAGDLAGAAGAFERALSLEPAFAAARLGLARVYAAAGRREQACAVLSPLGGPAPERTRNEYQRLLVSFDRGAAERFKEELCRKKTTGAATASPRRKP